MSAYLQTRAEIEYCTPKMKGHDGLSFPGKRSLSAYCKTVSYHSINIELTPGFLFDAIQILLIQ